MNEPSMRIVVRGRNWYCNLSFDEKVDDENTVRVYRDGNLVGFFDLGAVDVLYITETKGE